MTDENPQPDVLDEAIRQVDMALEQKLEALRQTALGATRDLDAPAQTPQPLDEPLADVSPMHVSATPATDTWASDAVLRPVEPTPAAEAPSQGGFVPDEPAWAPQAAAPAQSWQTPTSSAPSRGTASSQHATGVGMAPTTSIEDTDSWAHTRTALRMLQQSSDELRDLLPNEISRRLGDELSRELTNRVTQQVSAAVGDQVERVVRTELASPGAAIRSLQQTLPTMAADIQQGVTTELESSTALLQQVAEELPVQLERIERTVTQTLHEDVGQVERSVAENVTRLASGLTQELARTGQGFDDGIARVERSVDTGMRSVEGTVRGEFDRVARAMRTELDRVESSLSEGLGGPTEAVRQLQQDLPVHLQRIEGLVRDQNPTPWVERLADAMGDQHELARRQHEALLQDLASANGQLGRDLESANGRLASDVRASGQDLTRTLDSGLDKLVGKLDATVGGIESRLDGMERDITSRVGTLERGLSTQLETRMTALEGGLDQDRLQRVEDLETVVDTMTSGWTGMAGAMKSLFTRLEAIDGKLDSLATQVESMSGLETTLSSSVTSLEGLLDTQLGAVQKHLSELRPAPVVVTVSHPDATIEQSTRGGFQTQGS